jgi:hypothetical protein
MIQFAAHGWMAEVSQAATGSLITAIWQGILLAAMAGLGLRLLPKTPASVRFAIWFGVFLVVTGLPVIVLWPHAASVEQGAGRGPWLTLDMRWSVAIATMWVLASAVRAGTLVAAAFRVRALWRRATPVETSLKRSGEGSRRAQICTSEEVDRPTVIGFFAPKILIPGWLLSKLTPTELEQVVLHETGHLGRADDWMNLLQKIALVLFPLNPALAWVEHRLCFERELACDERVLRETGAPKAYAACLATLAEHRLGRRAVALALGAVGCESELGRRVGRILRRGERMKPLHARLVLGGAVLGLLVGVAELGRCPQLVGFAPALGPKVAMVTPPSKGETRGVFGYKAVAFHQNAAQDVRASGLVVRMPGSAEARHGVGGMTATQRQSGIPDGAARNRTAGMEAIATDNHQARQSGGRMVQWVEVRSWEDGDGSRLVLTTVRTSADVEGRGISQREAVQRSQADDERQSSQIHPFAAVPVRGGWLVFQL